MKKDQLIRQALSEIAQEGTTGHTDAWQQLHAKFEQPRSHSRFYLSRRYVFLLAVVAVVTTAAFVYILLMDSGLQKADEAGLVSHSNQAAIPTVFSTVPTDLSPSNKVSITQNGITVTLVWSYADELRVAWQLTITGLSIPKEASFEDYICDPYVTTQEGIHLTPTIGDSKILYDQPGNPIVISYISYQKIDASQYDQLNAALDLTVGPCANQWNFDQVHVDRPGPTSTPVPLIGTYHLDFQIPVNKGVTVTPNQTVEVNGIKMRLETIATTPSYTMVHLCYAAPSVPGLSGNTISVWDWSMQGVTIQSGKSDPVQLDNKFNPPEYEYDKPVPTELCKDLGFAAQVDLQSEKVVITISSLEADEPLSILLAPLVQAKVQERLAQKGVVAKFGSYGNYSWEITETRPGMTEDQANEIVLNLLKHKIVGPWKFSINQYE